MFSLVGIFNHPFLPLSSQAFLLLRPQVYSSTFLNKISKIKQTVKAFRSFLTIEEKRGRAVLFSRNAKGGALFIFTREKRKKKGVPNTKKLYENTL
jgi:hypothetical protein